MMKNLLGAMALCVFALCSNTASAATCDQLKATNVAVAGLVEKIRAGQVPAADGLKAGMAELAKLDLSDDAKKKVAEKTGPVLAKGAAATAAEVLPLFADAAKDLGEEAGKQKCQ